MKKTRLFLTILTLLVFFTGCWDYTEYQQLAQMYSIGIDFKKQTGEITLTLQYISTSESKGERISESVSGAVYSAKGKTIIDALTKLQQVTSGRIFFSYLQVIVIGEEAARYIMKDILSNFDRTPSIRSSVYLVIVPGRAEGVISTVDPFNPIASGKKIHNLLSTYDSGGSVFPVTLHEYSQMMFKEGLEPVAPKIISTAFTNTAMEDSGEALGGTYEDVRLHIEKKGNFAATGMAAFKGDNFVGWLNAKESLGLSWIKGKRVTTYKSTKTNQELDSDTNYSSNVHSEVDVTKILYFYITSSKSKVMVQLNNGKPEINIKLKIQADLRKYYNDNGTEYITPDIISSMESKLESSIKSDITAAIKKGQKELNSDIFGFGFSLYRQHPKEWHESYAKIWNDIFSDLSVNVDVDAKVNNTGTNIRKYFSR